MVMEDIGFHRQLFWELGIVICYYIPRFPLPFSYRRRCANGNAFSERVRSRLRRETLLYSLSHRVTPSARLPQSPSFDTPGIRNSEILASRGFQ
jgi:hypothetical protein